MGKITPPPQDPFVQSFLKYIEDGTNVETQRIIESYKEKMITDLEDVRQKIVAQASIRLSEIMSIQDLGRTVRIDIIKKVGHD